MALRELLRQRLSRENADRITQAVLADAALLPLLLDFFLQPMPEEASLAAMSLGNLARERADWLQPYQAAIFKAGRADLYPGILRNAMRIFSELPVVLPEDYPIPVKAKKHGFLFVRQQECKPETAFLDTEMEGALLDFSLLLINDPTAEVAPRVFAMGVAQNLCLKYPDLKEELEATIAAHLAYASPAFGSRGRRVITAIRCL